MEDVIKELCEFFDKRCRADRDIIAYELGGMLANIMCDEIEGASTQFELTCSRHRAEDMQDLLSAYTIFCDKLEKVKNNIEYDKKHKQ